MKHVWCSNCTARTRFSVIFIRRGRRDAPGRPGEGATSSTDERNGARTPGAKTTSHNLRTALSILEDIVTERLVSLAEGLTAVEVHPAEPVSIPTASQDEEKFYTGLM